MYEYHDRLVASQLHWAPLGRFYCIGIPRKNTALGIRHSSSLVAADFSLHVLQATKCLLSPLPSSLQPNPFPSPSITIQFRYLAHPLPLPSCPRPKSIAGFPPPPSPPSLPQQLSGVYHPTITPSIRNKKAHRSALGVERVSTQPCRSVAKG